MKKKVIAFYDILVYAIVCAPLVIAASFIFVLGKLNNLNWCLEYWYLVVVFALGIMVPLGGIFFLRFVEFNNDSMFVFNFPFVKGWNGLVEAMKSIDASWNNKHFISETKSVEIVKLTEEEKKTKVYFKHWFNKYLKINLKYGEPKYVYVGNYSKKQISEIIRILTNHCE